MKKSKIIIIIISAVLLFLFAGFLSFHNLLPSFANYLINRGLSFPEKSELSYDGILELRQYSKDDEDCVNSLYFYVTRKDEDSPLFVSDCEYRLFDFHVLEWGNGTYDIWAVSGDIGTHCYLYSEEGKWVRYSVDPEVKSTDAVWELTELCDDGDYGQGRQIVRENVPQEVVSYIAEWDAK